MTDNFTKRINDYYNVFINLGINTYISRNNDSPTKKFFEPLCEYFKCEPIYDFNGLYYNETCVDSIDLYGHGEFALSVKINGKKCDTSSKHLRYPLNINDNCLVSAFFETLDRIISYNQKQINATKNITENELWEILQNGLSKKTPKDGFLKTFYGKRGCDSKLYKAVVVSETNNIADQILSTTCGKKNNGMLFINLSVPLCGNTEFEFSNLSDYKKSVDNFSL